MCFPLRTKVNTIIEELHELTEEVKANNREQARTNALLKELITILRPQPVAVGFAIKITPTT